MAPTDYDFWLLDLDGTLVDVEPGYVHDVMGEVGNRLGVEITDREAEVLWHGYGGQRERVIESLDTDAETFWATFHEVEDPTKRSESTFLYEDAAVVAGLDRPTGLVTHCQQYLTDPVLRHHDIADWFDTVVCCTDDLGWKPDPAPVREAMTDLGVAHNGHVGTLVGDSAEDIGAARNAGLDGIHVQRYDPDERGVTVWGDRRIRSFEELI
ncbi:phosphoglycolate phosphatase [Natronoarchaeum philippinense]|uniref:Phosphoglycolate phosphatase n=1 Tax=Natronoarchaeum philippinense TaxID=558529 RepID=A0A285NAQ3_NATPI|nr:HAD family hydrolase [Natronoarchaeum philippinense]SNZ06007.1 phosphoglycolate phosphatase [Natronoarchaeum philippinense]